MTTAPPRLADDLREDARCCAVGQCGRAAGTLPRASLVSFGDLACYLGQDP